MPPTRPKHLLEAAEAAGEDFVPWGRLPGDTATSWRGFCYFRDLGLGRTLPQVAKFLNCSYGNVKYLNARYEWKARVLAYDAWADAQYRAEVERERVNLAQAHVDAAKMMREKAVEALNMVPPQILALKPEVALAVLKEALRLEQQLYSIRPLNTTEEAARDPVGVYLDSRPLPELIAMTRETLLALESKQARQQAVIANITGEPDGDA